MKILIVLIVFIKSLTPAHAGYLLVDLGILPGNIATEAKCVTDFGDIGGNQSLSSSDPTDTIGFLWSGIYGMKTLSNYSSVLTVEDGTSAGAYKSRSGTIAAVWDSKGTLLYSLPGTGPQSMVTSLSGGTITGWTTKQVGTSIKYYPCYWDLGGINVANTTLYYADGTPIEIFAYAQDAPTCHVLPTPGGFAATGNCHYFDAASDTIVNLTVGRSSPETTNSGFVYDHVNNIITNFDANLIAINQLGQIIGQKTINGQQIGLFIDGSTITQIPALTGYTDTYVTGLNNPCGEINNHQLCFVDPGAPEKRGINISSLYRPSAEVVGYCENSVLGKKVAFIWTKEEGIKKLPGLIDSAQTQANSINDLGEIVGSSTAFDGLKHGILWEYNIAIPDEGVDAAPELDPTLDPGPIALQDWVVTGIFSDSGNFFTIQSPRNLTGIKILGAYGVEVGDHVTVKGILNVQAGEKIITPDLVYINNPDIEVASAQSTASAQSFDSSQISDNLPRPIGLNQRSFLDATRPFRPTVLCCRTRLWGKIIDEGTDGNHFYRIDDGTGFVESPGGTYIDEDGNEIIYPRLIGIRVYTTQLYEVGETVVFTGIAGIHYGLPVLWVDTPL